MLIKFLQQYGKVAPGTIRNTHTDKDAYTLINSGVAEKYDGEDDAGRQQLADEVLQQVRAELKLGTANRPMFPGASAEQGFGPMNPKDFWLGKNNLGGSQFKSAADFLSAVSKAHKGHWDPRLKDISEGVSSEGGYLVPEPLANYIWQEILEDSPFFTQSTLLPMTSSTLKVPYIYDVDRSATGLHGIAVPQPAEASALTDISPSFGECNLRLHKIGGRCRVSNEQLEDSGLAMSTLLPRVFSDALSFDMQHQFLQGSGAGEALGVLNAPATITQAKEVGQGGNTIEYENLTRMWSRLLPAARKSAVWFFNTDCEVQLRSMAINVGTGGSSVWVLNAATKLPETLFGRPVYFSELMPTLGDEGDCLVFNPKAYAIGKKPNGTIRIDISEHARFENDQTVFRAVSRLDGQPLQSSEITPKYSANTMSHFVKLASR